MWLVLPCSSFLVTSYILLSLNEEQLVLNFILYPFLSSSSFIDDRAESSKLKQNCRFYNSIFLKFQAKSSLARHIQFLHEGKVKSKFRCSLCDMQFAHKETLRKHTETVCKHLFSTYLMLISFITKFISSLDGFHSFRSFIIAKLIF